MAVALPTCCLLQGLLITRQNSNQSVLFERKRLRSSRQVLLHCTLFNTELLLVKSLQLCAHNPCTLVLGSHRQNCDLRRLFIPFLSYLRNTCRRVIAQQKALDDIIYMSFFFFNNRADYVVSLLLQRALHPHNTTNAGMV